MTASDARIRQLVSELTETATPRPWAEVEHRSSINPTAPPRPRYRPLLVTAVVASAALLIGGLAWWAGRPTDSTIVPSNDVTTSAGPAPTSLVTNSSVPAVIPDPNSSSIEPVVSAPASTNTPPDPPTHNDDVNAQMQAVMTAALKARSAIDSVRATVTIHSTTTAADGIVTDQTDETHTFTLMSDGRMWTEGNPLLWASHDPTTATAQTATVQPDGSITYERITHADNPVFAAQFIGEILRLDNGVAPGAASVTDITAGGRAAWEIYNAPTPIGGDSLVQDMNVDKQTGLTTRNHSVTVTAGITLDRIVTVTDLETGVDMPSAFPGIVPADTPTSAAASGYGSGPFPNYSDAIAAFGSTFWVPAVRPPGTTVWVYSNPNPNSLPPAVRIEMPAGLARREITISADHLCPDPCPTPPASPGTNGLPILSDGAFAGSPYPINSDGSVQISKDGITVVIRGLDGADTLAIANTLIPLDESGRPQYDPKHTPVSDSGGQHVGWINTIDQSDRIYVALPESYTSADTLNPTAVGVTIVRDDNGAPIGIMTGLGVLRGGLINNNTDLDPAIKQQIIDDAITNISVVNGPIPTA